MTYSRDPHHLVYHYADGVADILGLSTAQQLSIRTAMHLALREQAAAYEATAADAATRIHLLANELEAALSTLEQLNSAQLSPLLHIPPSEQPVTVISTNGTQPSSISAGAAEHQVTLQVSGFVAKAAQEAATEAQPNPTPAPTNPGDRKPFRFTWGMLDDTSLAIARNLDAGKAAWRVVNVDDKRVIALAVIKELQLELAPGEVLSIEQFNARRPIWMTSFPPLSTGLGMTWKQMLAAAERA